MNQYQTTLRASAALALLLVVSSSASAQATRTWVSGVGDDVNPCSRTAPCKTFAGAISKTAVGGEIDCIDPGGFGAVTITKGMTIDGNGTFASILAAGTTGITINCTGANVNDVVTIRNISINGAATGINGINFISGGALHIENCVISNFAQKGVNFLPVSNSKLFIKDTIIRNNNNVAAGGGVKITPAAGISVVASLDNVRLERNQFGLLAEDRVKVSVRNSVAAGNNAQGFIAGGTVGPISLNLESCIAMGNGTFGIRNSNPTAASIIRISNCMVVNNDRGVSQSGASINRSFINNRIDGNTTADIEGVLSTKGQQ